MLFSAREIVTVPSSSGWRSTSSVRRLNSGSSSRNSTPLCARLISPGVGVLPPPTRPASLIVWCGERNGRVASSGWPGLQQAHRAVDARGLDRFAGDQLGQDRRHALGEHRLAGAGRAEHQEIVRAGGGDGDGPLGHLLPADVGEVDVVAPSTGRTIRRARRRRLDVDLAGEEADRLRRGC